MKKIICLLLAVAMLSLCACGKEPQAVEQTQPEQPQHSVPRPVTWADIDAIPIATANMTEEELRQICVDFFRLQLSFQWTPKETLAYNISSYDKHPELKPGTVYAGCPYISPSNTGNLYRVMDFYDSETGVLDTTQMTSQDFAWLIGNDCVTGPYWGWGRVVNSLLRFSNNYMTQDYGCIPVGPYHYEGITQWSEENNTPSVCNANGKQIMYESYAQLKPADGLYTQYNEAKNSHMRMVAAAPTVVLDEAGNIDGLQSFVTYLDQGSSFEPYNQDGTVVQIQGGVDVRISFRALYDAGYLPFTRAELIGEDPVDPALIRTQIPVPEKLTLDNLRRINFSSNYTISHFSMELRDEKGNVTYEKTLYTQRRLEQDASVGQLMDMDQLQSILSTGPQQVSVTCRVSTGQLLTVCEGLLSA